ncbi:jg7927 [Pararge aegeria aegeria]|uniref:Jg7927 protein n=1 Tax=Pararge aegeria aegeria TaxID=348720 RepID=A0A8S4R2X1_9NEOP|nr:jg7927 [Pararge aegeria aegeria]
MHRKSLEAAHHLKESGSEREGSEAEAERAPSASPHRHDTHDAQVPSADQQRAASFTCYDHHRHVDPLPATALLQLEGSRPYDMSAQSSPGSSTTASSSAKGRASPEGREMYEDPEAFRNNSIACLRAKAQEHQARLLSNNLLLQVPSSIGIDQASDGRELYEDLEAFRKKIVARLHAEVQEYQDGLQPNNIYLQVRGMQRASGAASVVDEDGPADIDVGTEPPPLDATTRLY